MPARQAPQREPVSITVGRQLYAGTYTVTGRGPTAIVRVECEHGSKPTQRGGLPALLVAKRLLRELVADHLASDRPE